MFKTLFENLIVTLTGATLSTPVEALSVILSLVCVTILIFAIFNIFMPNSRKINRVILVIVIVVISVCVLASYGISVITITQYSPVGGVA